MNNTTTNNNITTNNQTNKENNMITIEMTKELLQNYKAAKQENKELRATLENNNALKSEVNDTEKALVKRILDIQTAIEAMENENESLKKAVSEEGDLQVVLNSYKLSSNILDEIEEMMTAPEKVEEVDSTKIPICAGRNVTALLSALKQPSPPLPPLKKPNPPSPSPSPSPSISTSVTVTEVKPVKVVEPQKQTVTTVKATKVVNNVEPQPLTKESSNQKFMQQLEKAERAEENKVKVIPTVASVNNKSFPILTHKLSDGTVVDWKEATFRDAGLDEEVADFVSEFVEEFDVREVYSFKMHQQFRKAVIESDQAKEVPFILTTANYVHYLIKSFFCTNQVAENTLTAVQLHDAKVMLDQRAYLEGCGSEPSNCF